MKPWCNRHYTIYSCPTTPAAMKCTWRGLRGPWTQDLSSPSKFLNGCHPPFLTRLQSSLPLFPKLSVRSFCCTTRMFLSHACLNWNPFHVCPFITAKAPQHCTSLCIVQTKQRKKPLLHHKGEDDLSIMMLHHLATSLWTSQYDI